MSEIIIDWNNISRKEWEHHLTEAGRSSFQQTWAYGEICHRSGREVNRFVASENGEILAIGQIVTRRFLGFLKISLLLMGPVWLKEISEDEKKNILMEIRRKYPLRYFNLFAFSPDENVGQAIYENMGFRRIITGNSTIIVDLTLSEQQLWQNLYGKTRTDIRKAEKSDFDVITGDHNHHFTDWLLKKEGKQQKEKKYQGLPAGLSRNYGQLYGPEQGVYTAFAVSETSPDMPPRDTPIAGLLFLRHGRHATYHIGWNGKEGRKCRALNLLLWKMILNLKAAGIENLDLGGVNTDEGAEIARYKLGYGGRVITLDGTFM